ncbi:hypothetical protein [Nannocystis pusilla]|uniref:hypothetical protein n=1 Tax=Nannocystis pusilla TaxID=889268 RepID=UPI003DA5FBBC
MGAFQPSEVGALELKAAWMEVPNPDDAQWNRYKLAQAVVVDPATQKCQALTVALVGLHIIHKTQAQPTWVWATFEHVDNAPDAADAATTQKLLELLRPELPAAHRPGPRGLPVQQPGERHCRLRRQPPATVLDRRRMPGPGPDPRDAPGPDRQ